MRDNLKALFCKTRILTKMALRREWLTATIWIAMLVLLNVAVTGIYPGLFATEEERMGVNLAMSNPAMVALMGPFFGEEHTFGAMIANEMLLMTIVCVALMNIFMVVRNTRADEDAGRLEILRSLPVGRLSGLAAAMIVAVIVNVALGLIIAFGMAACAVESVTLGGSMVYAMAITVSGLFFAAVGALSAQVCRDSKGATGMSMIIFGALYMLRAAGDVADNALSYISPLGLVLRCEAFVSNKPLPIVIVLLLAAVVAGAALYLCSIRDLGQGFIESGAKKSSAARYLRSPQGLAFGLLRNTLITWFFAMLMFGAMYGSVMGDMESFINDNEFIKGMFPEVEGVTRTEMFMSMLMAIISIMAAIPAMSAMLRLRAEEKSSRADVILSSPVSRHALMRSYLVVALVTGTVMSVVSAFGLWAAGAVAMDEPATFGSLLRALVVYLPAIWFMVGLCALIIGVLPAKTVLCWAYLGFSFMLIYMGPMLQFPDWTQKLSPFGYMPQPGEDIKYWVLLLITAVAAALTAAGFMLYRRRDALIN